MKELSMEEKAKAYDEAIKKFDVILNLNTVKESGTIFADDVRKILPELKESEDEKIRKALIRNFTNQHSSNFPTADGFTREQILAWLEKQGEQKEAELTPVFKIGDVLKRKDKDYTFRVDRIQGGYYHCDRNNGGFFPIEKQGNWELIEQKHTDNAEPKFEVGDWIVYNRNDDSSEILHIYDIRDNRYYFDDNIHFSWSVKECDEKCHLWTIQDAKDGNVLVSVNPFIFKGFGDEMHPNDPTAYCGIDTSNHFIIYLGKEPWTNHEVHPATKKEADFLFQRMKEAGYEWDIDKKELKKIEQNPAWNEKIKGLNELETYILSLVPDRSLDAIKVDAKNIRCIINKEQNPAWSEEDERMYQSILDDTVQKYLLDCNQFAWLKSLKDRVQQQPNQEWSEEDEQNSAFIVAALDAYNRLRKGNNNSAGQEEFDRAVNWIHHRFKSLRPQPKQEWSEEDEYQINTILHGLDLKRELYKKEGNQLEEKRYKTQYDWLRSLKPNRWKPSEEQMDALDKAKNSPANYYDIRLALESLYNDLLKL